MPYRLSKAAERDLDRVFEQGISEFGEAQAETYLAELLATLSLLAKFPSLGRERPTLGRPVRIHPFVSHVVVYRILDSEILIVRVRHGREDWAAKPA